MSLQKVRRLHSQWSDRVGDGSAGIRSLRGIEWYKARSGGTSIAVSRLHTRIIHQVGIRQGRGSPHWNQLAEMN